MATSKIETKSKRIKLILYSGQVFVGRLKEIKPQFVMFEDGLTINKDLIRRFRVLRD